MNLFAIPPFITSIFLLFLGGIIYLKNRKSKPNIVFTCLCLSLFVWLFGYTEMYLSKDTQSALFWARNGFIGIIFIPILVYHFVVSFLKIKRSYFLLFLYLSSIPALILHRTNHIYVGVAEHFWGYYPVAGSGYIFFLLLFTLSLLMSLFQLIIALKREIQFPYLRMQIRYIVLSYGIGLTGSIDYLIKLGIDVYPWGYMTTALFMSLMGFAVVKYRLMNIKVAVKTVMAPLFSLAIIATPILFVSLFFPSASDFIKHNFWSQLFLIVISIVAYYILYNNIGFLIGKFFPSRNYSFLLNTYKDKAGKLNSVTEVSQLITNTIRETRDFISASLILQDRTKEEYYLRSSFGLPESNNLQLTRKSPLTNFLLNNRNNKGKRRMEVVIRGELSKILPDRESGPIMADMEKFDAQIALPLIDKDELVGILFVGNRLSGDIHDNEDYVFFKELTERSTINIVDAELREEAEIVRAQRERDARLISLGQISAAMAHEIKNPLVSIKTFAELLPTKFDDKEFREKFSSLALDETERINSLIMKLLNFTHPRKHYSEPLFVEKLIEESLFSLQIQLSNQKIKVEKDFPSGLPRVRGDKNELKEVFLNIFTNSIQVMPGGGKICISAKKEKIRAQTFVKIFFLDTGGGISEKNLNKVFEPFFTTRNRGSGLGLFITYKIIHEHQGEIRVRNVDKGAEFCVSLPTYEAKTKKEQESK